MISAISSEMLYKEERELNHNVVLNSEMSDQKVSVSRVLENRILDATDPRALQLRTRDCYKCIVLEANENVGS